MQVDLAVEASEVNALADQFSSASYKGPFAGLSSYYWTRGNKKILSAFEENVPADQEFESTGEHNRVLLELALGTSHETSCRMWAMQREEWRLLVPIHSTHGLPASGLLRRFERLDPCRRSTRSHRERLLRRVGSHSGNVKLMNRHEQTAQKLLVEQWNAIHTQLGRLSLPAARPNDAYRIFSLIEDQKVEGQVGFEINPVTFHVPERANQTANLYIVARGRIYLDIAELEHQKVKTVQFGTEVGYFRKKDKTLEHVFGAHYDLAASEIGHPLFHAQMRSYSERGAVAAEEFQLDCTPSDLVKGVLRTIRLPIAQMDFFSLVLQITADHLMSRDSGEEEKQAFAQMRRLNQTMQGAGHLWPSLASAPPCMRSFHWYG